MMRMRMIRIQRLPRSRFIGIRGGLRGWLLLLELQSYCIRGSKVYVAVFCCLLSWASSGIVDTKDILG
jgi:hypothetical protein